VELTDRIIPARLGGRRGGPGRHPDVTDAELICLAVAQVLLRYNDEHHWLRAAPSRVGQLFPRLLSQPAYNRRLRASAELMEAALRWLAGHTPASSELLRLLDGTPVVCGRSREDRHPLGPGRLGRLWPRHLAPLLLLGQPAAAGHHPRRDRDGVRVGQPQTGRRTRGRRGHAGWGPGQPAGTGHAAGGRQGLCRPSVPDRSGRPGAWHLASRSHRRTRPGVFPNWLRQRIEAIIWTLKHQLGLDRHGGRIPAGLWARVVQRLLALNTAIWFNWQIGAPTKRSLIAYDH
jgi:hypothetical protein